MMIVIYGVIQRLFQFKFSSKESIYITLSYAIQYLQDEDLDFFLCTILVHLKNTKYIRKKEKPQINKMQNYWLKTAELKQKFSCRLWT